MTNHFIGVRGMICSGYLHYTKQVAQGQGSMNFLPMSGQGPQQRSAKMRLMEEERLACFANYLHSLTVIT